MNVELLSVMGNDLTVVNSARVSFNKCSQYEIIDTEWDYANEIEKPIYKLNAKDEALIAYLAKNDHWTPFSQCMLQFRITIPIFVARQYMRSNVGLTRNEVSRRYISEEPTFWNTNAWRLSAKNVKQGSSDEISPISNEIQKMMSDHCADSLRLYNLLLNDFNICPEQARTVLPLAMYTEFVETGSLYAYFRICK